MNKKISTLMAAALAAGGLFSSGDLQAQLQYKGETTYETVENATVVSTEGKTQNYYLVFQSGGEDYIAVVEDNALIAKHILTAKKADMLKIKKVSTGYNIYTKSSKESDLLQFYATVESPTPKYAFGIGEGKTQYFNWSTVNTDKTSVTFGLGGGNIQLKTKTFTIEYNKNYATSYKSFKAKLISTSELTEIENPCDVVEAAKVDFSKSYPIIAAGKALIVDAKGNLALTDYNPQDKSQFWQPTLVETGKNAGYATLKNEKTGTLMQVGGNNVAIKLTYDADAKGFLFEGGFDAFSLYEIEGTTFTEVKVKYGNNTVPSFMLGQVGTMYLTAEDLRSIFGDSFNADIKRTEGNKSLDNNVFVGNLTPVTLEKNNTSGDYTTKVSTNITGDKFMLQNGNGNIIVVTNKKYTVGVDTYGYKLDEVTPRELALALNGDNDDVTYACWFSINADENFEVGADQTVNAIYVTNEDGSTTYKLGALDVEDVPTLAAEVSGSNVVTPITVKLGKFNTVDLTKLLAKPTFFSVTVKNIKKDAENYGKVLGLDEYGNVAYVKASDALVGYPETQWALTVVNDMLVLKNREYPEAKTSYLGNFFTYDPKQMYNVSTNVFAYNGDTLEIKPVETTDYDGFKVLDAYELRDQEYHIGLYSDVWGGSAYLAENHNNDHKLGMDIDIDEATSWKLAAAWYVEKNSLGEVTLSRPDTLKIESELGYYDATKKEFTTTKKAKKPVFLKLLAYSLQNADNNEYVIYDDKPGRNFYATGLVDDKDGEQSYNKAKFFALKMTGDDKYEMVEVNRDVNSTSTDDSWLTGFNGLKMYGGDAPSKGVFNQIYRYNREENDQFTIEPVAAPEYRKLSFADSISIFREDNPADVLYAGDKFLDIANNVQNPDVNMTFYVDTAYVDRGTNNRWEYLLALDARHKEAEEWCGVEGHPHHKADTTWGRFLVNLMDSAYVYHDNNIHKNDFINEEDGEQCAKLGFVEGYHTHDTLYLKRPNETYDALSMTREEYRHSIAKFAFRIVDNSSKAFVIETGAKNFYTKDEARKEVTPGYLKWMNGVVVVVNDIDKAEVFNLNVEGNSATANDEITTSEVKVIAGNGQITIAGAAGKKVVVSNILGQVVANTVISSDNTTIAAPQGIVVVAVEGEEAVKAIVK